MAAPKKKRRNCGCLAIYAVIGIFVVLGVINFGQRFGVFPAFDPLPTATPVFTNGLGMTLAEWEIAHGKPTQELSGTFIYEQSGGSYFVVPYNNKLSQVEYGWATELMPAFDAAKAMAQALMPRDAQYRSTYTSSAGNTIEVYFSQYLADNYPDALYSGIIGEFIVSYRNQSDGKISSVSVATGNNP